jgi:lipopolysaccharide transport system permease protein
VEPYKAQTTMMEMKISAKSKTNFTTIAKELWQYRDLVSILAWRDYKVRYAQTFLGFVWAFLQPLATLLIFTLIFSRVAKVDTGEIPYPLFAQSGMLAWTYFAFLISQAGNSIVGAQAMVKKIYFPRLVIPISKAMVGLIDFLISLVILVLIGVYYQFVPSSNIVYLPLFVLLLIIGGLGVGIWVSALTVRYRDFSHLLPFMVQIGMYASPVAYAASMVPEKYQWVYALNPMVGVIEGVRWSIIGGAAPGGIIYFSMGVMLLLFFSGLWYFKKVERVMADLI